jgi:nucleotide-binding universal stress UspA family protein
MIFERIVVATDFSDRAEPALAAARHAAELFGARELRLLHVLDTGLGGTALPYGPLQQEAEETFEKAEARALEQLKAIDLAVPGAETTCDVRRGDPAYEVALFADEVAADLIVVATQGRGAIGRAVIGSVTSGVLGYAHCPVLVTSRGRRALQTVETLLVAVDLSPVSAQVLRLADRIREQTGAHVRVHSVYQKPFVVPGEHPMYFGTVSRSFEIRAEEEHRKLLGELVAQAAPTGHLETTVRAAREAHTAILDLERTVKPNLTLIGSSGFRTWGRRLFGTNAERIVARAQGPVLVLPDQLRRGVEAEPNLGAFDPDRAEKRHPDEQMVYAVFQNEEEVRGALEALTKAQISPEDISVLTQSATYEERFKPLDRPDQAFTAGGTIGASVGGILGGLASFGAATGVGLMVVGPAVAMGLAGGLIATLLGFGVPRHEAERLERAVRAGGTVVAVTTHDFDSIQTAKECFADQGVLPKRLTL